MATQMLEPALCYRFGHTIPCPCPSSILLRMAPPKRPWTLRVRRRRRLSGNENSDLPLSSFSRLPCSSQRGDPKHCCRIPSSHKVQCRYKTSSNYIGRINNPLALTFPVCKNLLLDGFTMPVWLSDTNELLFTHRPAVDRASPCGDQNRVNSENISSISVRKARRNIREGASTQYDTAPYTIWSHLLRSHLRIGKARLPS